MMIGLPLSRVSRFLLLWSTVAAFLLLSIYHYALMSVTPVNLTQISNFNQQVLAGLTERQCHNLTAKQEFRFGNCSSKIDKTQNEDNDVFFGRVEPGEIVYTLIVCELKDVHTKRINTTLSNSFQRQLNQIEVILKTAAIFAKRSLHFIFITNTVDTFVKIKKITMNWPKNITANLRITRRPLWKPPNQDKLLQRLRPCSAACLFIHETLPDVDAAIYIDTDTLFLRSPEDLWTKFALFNSEQIAGIAPCHYYYNKRMKFGFAGDSGINAGVILMNLTRMRDNNLHVNLTPTYINIFAKYEAHMILADQDILNHFYGLYPKLLYSLDCSWNMRTKICYMQPFPCKSEDDGISLLHGCAMTFYQDDFPTFIEVFKMFLHFDVNKDDVRRVPQMLQESFKKASMNKMSPCQSLRGFNDWMLTYPSKIVSEKYTSNLVL